MAKNDGDSGWDRRDHDPGVSYSGGQEGPGFRRGMACLGDGRSLCHWQCRGALDEKVKSKALYILLILNLVGLIALAVYVRLSGPTSSVDDAQVVSRENIIQIQNHIEQLKTELRQANIPEMRRQFLLVRNDLAGLKRTFNDYEKDKAEITANVDNLSDSELYDVFQRLLAEFKDRERNGLVRENGGSPSGNQDNGDGKAPAPDH